MTLVLFAGLIFWLGHVNYFSVNFVSEFNGETWVVQSTYMF